MAAKKIAKPSPPKASQKPSTKTSRKTQVGNKIKQSTQNVKSAGENIPLKPYKKMTPAQIAASKKAYEKSTTKKVIGLVETFTPLGAVEPFVKAVSGKNPRTGKSVNRLAELGTSAFYAAPVGGKKIKAAVRGIRNVGRAKDIVQRQGVKQGGRKVGASFGRRVS